MSTSRSGRFPSDHPELHDLLRRHGFGFVIADTAGKLSYAEHVTGDFAWSREGKDVYVYFDNGTAV